MDVQTNCSLASALAQKLRGAREELTRRWLDRIADRVSLDQQKIFPTDELLDHVPLLIDGVAEYLEDPAEEIGADMPVVAKAMELGALRLRQGFDAYEILKEYELLGGIVFSYLAGAVDEIEQPCPRSELLHCLHRVFRAIETIQQVTTGHFLRLGAEQVREREDRLRSFNRLVSHELKNRVGAIIGAHELLASGVDESKRDRFMAMIGKNADAIRVLLENLTSLSRFDSDTRQQRNVSLGSAAHEAARQLREMARSRGVSVLVADDLPEVEVNAAAVELCLTNYLSNAIKYSDPSKDDRWVRVEGHLRDAPDDRGASELVVEVRDNGLGVPADARRELFERFFRAHEGSATGVEGTGLGLSIVRETVNSLGGSAWAEFCDDGSVFSFSLPCRRESDLQPQPSLPSREALPESREPVEESGEGRAGAGRRYEGVAPGDAGVG